MTQCTTWTSLTTTLPPQTMQQLLHTRYFLSFSAIFMKSAVIKRALIHLLIAQACHSFTPNSSFVNLYHPRFSNILLTLIISMLLLSNEYIQCNKGALGLNICRLVRFGKIMSIIALRDLHPGEEILVSLCSNFFVEIESFPSFFCHLFSVITLLRTRD